MVSRLTVNQLLQVRVLLGEQKILPSTYSHRSIGRIVHYGCSDLGSSPNEGAKNSISLIEKNGNRK